MVGNEMKNYTEAQLRALVARNFYLGFAKSKRGQ